MSQVWLIITQHVITLDYLEMRKNAQDNKQELKNSMNKSKRPDTMETVLFAIALLQRIPRHKKITASELRDQLSDAGIERDLRTIQRQLEMLSRYFGIDCDKRSKPYGYSWFKCSTGLALPILSRQESLLLALAEQQLAHLLPSSLMKSMESFFSQADYDLSSKNEASKEREWLSKVRVVSETQPLITPEIQSDIFEEVSNALYRNQWLNVEYCNSSGKITDKDVMPLGLALQGTRLYLVCRFHGYDEERSLALHRIQHAKASNLTFERPTDFDLQQYDANGQFGFGHGERITLTFIVSKNSGFHLLEYKLSKDQTVKDLGDELEITATVVDSAQLDWWLNGFGDDVRDVSKEPVNPERDSIYEDVLLFILEKQKVSPSAIQRTFSISYNRATKIVDEMEQLGIVSAMSSNGKREILLMT